MAELAGMAGLGRTPEESEDLAAVIDTIHRFGREELDASAIDAAHSIPRSVLDMAGELGLFSLSIPEEHDGFGMSLQGVSAAIMAMAQHDRSVATTIGLHLGLGTRGLVRYGSESLKERYLPRLASGELIASFATTEASAGSDLHAIRTRAVEDGDDLLVNGEKIYVTNGGFADLYTITASTPGLGGFRRGHSMLALERADAGVNPGAEEDKLGMRGSSTITLNLDDIRVSPDRVIGEPGKGMGQLQHVLSWGRTAMAAGCTGTSQGVIPKTVDHVLTRQQFGKPIGQFEVVRSQIAEMATLTYAMEAMVRYTGAVESDDAALVARSTTAKVFCSDENWRVCDTALQLHGGLGYIEETGIALLLRDGRVTRIFEGANDVLLSHQGTLEATRPPTTVPLAGQVERLHDLAARADAFIAGLHEHRDALRKRHKIRIIRRQRVLHLLGQLAVLRDVTEAVLLRADGEGTEHAAHLAAHWLDLASLRARALLGEPADSGVADAIADYLYERAQ